MNSINTLPYASPPPRFFAKTSLTFTAPQNSFPVKHRRSRTFRRRKKFDSDPTKPYLDTGTNYSNDAKDNDQGLKLVFDVSQISTAASSKLERVLVLTEDAFQDLRTLVTLDENNRVVFSCRKSTLQYAGVVFLCGFVAVSACRALSRLWSAFSRKLESGKRNVVVRRDRSLGGREVVVAVVDTQRREDVGMKSFRALDNPLALPGWVTGSGLKENDWRPYWVRSHQNLPKWWPDSVAEDRGLVLNEEEYRREANRLVRAITDYRTRGKDVTENDVIQLRRICRASGVQVSFDTTNTRDAFYRASINFVLDACSRAPNYSTSFEIDGENAQQFVAGLAENIGLKNIRAARMVSAAVAARTRSSFLQAWALEVQGKHSEAVYELSKICLTLRAFPPEEASPEMEMVARGLGKHLKLEQRELLMNMFTGVCGEESHRSAADALGLMFSPKVVGDR